MKVFKEKLFDKIINGLNLKWNLKLVKEIW